MGERGEKGEEGVRRVMAVERSVRIVFAVERRVGSDVEWRRAVEGPVGFLIRIKSPCKRRNAWARLFRALA